MTPKLSLKPGAVIRAIESFLTRFVQFANADVAFVAALWVLGTYLWPDFDTYPYLVITSDVKRSGKTRFAELLSFLALRGEIMTAITGPALFQAIKEDQPTLFIDEAEQLSSETNPARPILNSGFRRGQSVPRWSKGGRVEWPTYCPKGFILIGDVFDTLRDRAIVFRMWRGEPKERFLFKAQSAEGNAIGESIATLFGVDRRKPSEQSRQPSGVQPTELTATIYETYAAFGGLPFLFDRDEDIWLPLFAIARACCPEREEELRRIAVDLATEKTQEARDHKALHDMEKLTEDSEYAMLLLRHVDLITRDKRAIGTTAAIDQLKAIPTAPWRKYRGDGLTAERMAQLLRRFGITPQLCKIKGKVTRGYYRREVDAALKRNPQLTEEGRP